MTFETLDTIVLDFDDFRNGYRYRRSSEPQPVYVELEGLSGTQKGDVHPVHEYSTDLPKRYLPLSEFLQKTTNVSWGDTKEEVLSNRADLSEDDDQFEEVVETDHRDVLTDWWRDMLRSSIDVCGCPIEVNWVDGEDPLDLRQYFRNRNVRGRDY